jgi:hypothetical protein
VRTIFFIRTRDDTCVGTEGGTVEMYFATVEDLKIALWRALIYPAAHKRQLNDLENGFHASIAVSEAQWKAFTQYLGWVGRRIRRRTDGQTNKHSLRRAGESSVAAAGYRPEKRIV